jgi:hypothetical protein
LDESLGFAIGLRAVWPGAFQANALSGGAGFEDPTPIIAAVVREHAADAHPAARKPAMGASEKRRRRPV